MGRTRAPPRLSEGALFFSVTPPQQMMEGPTGDAPAHTSGSPRFVGMSEEEATRKIALEVIARRRPASLSSAAPFGHQLAELRAFL